MVIPATPRVLQRLRDRSAALFWNPVCEGKHGGRVVSETARETASD